ncbi:MAG: hypothetical protein HYZ89_04475 [Candidatus Omnitrophica bacterium]|nr:hypothetical protein [Candidatus Omnitrophota bacterium]
MLIVIHLATWPLGHSTVEAAVSKGQNRRLETAVISETGGKITSPRFSLQGSAGEPVAGVPSSTLGSGRVGQAGFIAVTLGRRQASPGQLDITVLHAKTEPFGVEIAPKTWQRDADPVFLWEAPTGGLDIAGYSFALDAMPDDTVDTTATSWDVAKDPIQKLADGQHTFWVKAVNSAGNSGKPISFEIWIDTTPPTITAYSPPPGSLLNTLSPTLTASFSETASGIDPQAVRLVINGGRAQPSLDETATTMTASGSGLVKEGTNRIDLRITDRAGNASTPLLWTFVVDTTPPTGSILINGGSSMTTSVYVTLNLTASDAISGVTRMLLSNDPLVGYVDEPFASVRQLWRLTAVRGAQKVYVKFGDGAGNVSEPISAEIELGLLAPETIILSGPAGVTPDRTAKFTFTCPEGNCVFSYAFDYEEWSPWSNETTATSADLPFGNHYFKVKAAREINGVDGIQIDEEDPTPAERTWIVGVEAPVNLMPKGAPVKLWRLE